MASWVLSQCGLRPLPHVSTILRTRIAAKPIKLPALTKNNITDLGFGSTRISSGRFGSWGVKVSAPLRVASTEDEEERMRINGDEEEIEFDPGSPPPFKLADVKAAIPKHCWVKDPWRSMSYVVRDVVVVLGWLLLRRISHRTHHQNHGHVENDESWHPLPERIYRTLDKTTQMLRFTLPFPLLAYPFYLWNRSPGKTGSHFEPSSDLFVPSEKKDVITSAVCWTAMAALLVGLSFVIDPIQMLKLYGIPYWVFVMWLDLVTYMHHHGHENKLPWYRGKEWSYLRGGLTTLDRDYGLINNIHHDIGTHVVLHLFPQIPHYHLVEATEAAKPVFGKYYREPKKSGPLPFHLLGNFITSLKKDHYVSDSGDVVYYQTDPKLSSNGESMAEDSTCCHYKSK